jgi:iron complex transport system ATP-binding protein
VEEALSLMHLSELSQRPFAQLSDGQRQRLMVARALCQEPEVLILDEPTSYLDIRYKLELLELLNTLAREKQLAIVLSLHELELAEKISDALVCIHAGRAERIGTPEELFAGDYLPRLYGIDPALWPALSQSPELPPCLGEPQVFVLGGGGKGIPVYRKLRRLGIPFAAGVIAENDLDYPAARALAAQLVTVGPFESAGGAEVERCAALLERCGVLISCPDRLGAVNEACRGLLELEGVRILSAAAFLSGRQCL